MNTKQKINALYNQADALACHWGNEVYSSLYEDGAADPDAYEMLRAHSFVRNTLLIELGAQS